MSYFINLADANAQIAARKFDTAPWDEIPTDAAKLACLAQAYDRIYYSKEFILPTYAEASVADLVVLQKAQIEMAFYLAIHASDEDRRKGLQAQATVGAGIVKETYDKDKLYDTPIPPFVRDLLCAYLAGDPGQEFGAVDLCRDENESVGTKVCDFD